MMTKTSSGAKVKYWSQAVGEISTLVHTRITSAVTG